MWFRAKAIEAPKENQATAPAGSPADDPMRRATVLAVAVVGLLFGIKTGWSAGTGGVGQVSWVVAMFVLPSMYTMPSLRRRINRHRRAVLTAQAALTWVPFALFGGSWNIGLGGLLAALTLLTVRSRVSWLVAGLLLGADIVMRVAVAGTSPWPGWPGVLSAGVLFVDDSLYLFTVVRLAQIVGEVEQARREARTLTVERERAHAAQVLHAAVGLRLADIAAQASAAGRVLDRDAEEARKRIAAAGATARETVARARAITGHQGAWPTPEKPASLAGGRGGECATGTDWAGRDVGGVLG